MAIPKIKNYSFDKIELDLKNKVDWEIDPQKSVLLIHDMQNYFVDFYQKDAEPMTSTISNIKSLKKRCKSNNIPVIYTAQPKDQSTKDRALLTDFWGPGLSKDNRLVEILEEIKPEEGDISYTKWRYSALQRTPLLEYMQQHNKKQLIICGIYAHIGILATALEAFMKDIQVFVVGDAIADFSADEHNMAINYISQRCGKIETLKKLKEKLENNIESTEEIDIKKDIAEVLMLPVSEIHDNDNLMYLGLDSIRLMSLIEKWQQKNINIGFADLAESVTITAWKEAIDNKVKNNTEELTHA